VIKIVIPETIASTNKGEAAILEGIRESLASLGEIHLVVFSPQSQLVDDRRNYSGRYEVLTGCCLDDLDKARYSGLAAWSWYHKSVMKLVLFSLIARISQRMARFLCSDELLNAMASADVIMAAHDGRMGPGQAFVVLASRIMGKPIALFGGGKGSTATNTWRTRRLLQFAVRHSILCTVRDRGTRKFLVAQGVPEEQVHLFPDPAVLLRPSSENRVREIMRKEHIPDPNRTPLLGLVPVIGGVVARRCFSEATDKTTRRLMRVELWVEIVMHLLQYTEAHLVLLPHTVGPGPENDDRVMCREIFGHLKDTQGRVTLVDNEYSPAELKRIMKCCQFVLSERAHALIGALTAGTPGMALTVQEDARMHDIVEGMFNMKAFDLNTPDITEMKNVLSSEWDNRQVTATRMTSSITKIHREATTAAQLLVERIRAALGGKAK